MSEKNPYPLWLVLLTVAVGIIVGANLADFFLGDGVETVTTYVPAEVPIDCAQTPHELDCGRLEACLDTIYVYKQYYDRVLNVYLARCEG